MGHDVVHFLTKIQDAVVLQAPVAADGSTCSTGKSTGITINTKVVSLASSSESWQQQEPKQWTRSVWHEPPFLPKYSSDGGLSMSNSIFFVRRSSSSSGWAMGALPWKKTAKRKCLWLTKLTGGVCAALLLVALHKTLTSMNRDEACKVKQNAFTIINMQSMVFSLPFPSEIPDPGSGPSGGAAKKVVHILLCNTSMWKYTLTLTNPLFGKIMITEESYFLSVAYLGDRSRDWYLVLLWAQRTSSVSRVEA